MFSGSRNGSGSRKISGSCKRLGCSLRLLVQKYVHPEMSFISRNIYGPNISLGSRNRYIHQEMGFLFRNFYGSNKRLGSRKRLWIKKKARRPVKIPRFSISLRRQKYNSF
jgi:hypothetical protein